MVRRRLLAACGVLFAGPGAVLAACGRQAPPAAEQPSKVDRGTEIQGDIEVLNAVLELEHGFVAAYELGRRALRGDARALAGRLAEHEREHVSRLAAAVRDLGGRPLTAPPAKGENLSRAAAEEVMDAWLALEGTAVAAYIDALPKLSDAGLRRLVAGILATEAEHLAVLRGRLERRQVPDAFVTGENRA